MKIKAFTLGEVLVTLAIVGVLALLIIPGLVKDVNNKANMSLLQKTFSDLDAAITKDMTQNGATSLDNLLVRRDPIAFLKLLDTIKTDSTNNIVFFPTGGYKAINGDTIVISKSTYKYSAILKNGVGIALKPTYNDSPTKPAALLIIDLNGEAGPNIAGVDLFQASIKGYDDPDNLIHFGMVSYIRDQDEFNTNSLKYADLKTNCKKNVNGVISYCTAAAIISGFHPDYLNIDVEND